MPRKPDTTGAEGTNGSGPESAAGNTGRQGQDPELQGMPQPPEHDDSDEGADVPPDAAGVGAESDSIAAHGFVPLHRRFQTKWWWEHRPWSYGQLFLWLLMNANYKPRQAEYNGEIISIPRGGVATSKLALHERSGLSRSTIDLFVTKMVHSGELEILQAGHNGCVVRLCHYEEYTAVPQRARQRTGNGPGNRPASDHTTDQATGRQRTRHT